MTRYEQFFSFLQPPMTNLRLDERSLHPTNNGPTSVSNNASANQQQTHRVGGNQPPQQQQHPQQQRVPRGGLVQRGMSKYKLNDKIFLFKKFAIFFFSL